MINDDWRDRLRLAVDLTQRKHSAIAWDAGISPGGLSRILTGRTPLPHFQTVVNITHACGEQVGWILREPRAPFTSIQIAQLVEAADLIRSSFPTEK